MSVLPRGARNRRGARRPGWQLLTALLVLAILASSTLVFTSRVELLRLAVILSLWAAVLAAFVSVIYRRQSELDQARARDMKFVYDLQLEREISARREYELAVETHLRRQLTREVSAQAADEIAALRAELFSLRSNLEALLGADLENRPALESDRVAEQIAMPMPPPPGRVESSRVPPTAASGDRETGYPEPDGGASENRIIDVPEEPLTPPPPPPPPPPRYTPPPPPPPAPPPPRYTPPPPPPTRERPAQPAHRAPEYAPDHQPAARGAHRRPEQAAEPPAERATAPWRPPETAARRGRHWSPADAAERQPDPRPEPLDRGDPARGRHRVEAPEPEGPPRSRRHRNAEEPEPDTGQHTGGQSVADLMARLQDGGKSRPGGRRRRED